MTSKQDSKGNERVESETDVSAPSQDSDCTTETTTRILSSSSIKYISDPVAVVNKQASSAGNASTSSSPMHRFSPQTSPPPHDSYIPSTSSYPPTGDDPSAEIALVGRMSSKVVAESERFEYTDQQVDEVQQATDTGGSSEMLLQSSTLPPVKPTIDTACVTGANFINSPRTECQDKARRICEAVSTYYMERFIDRWKKKTKQEPSTITVVAALLFERRDDFKVVVLTAGTRVKYECSYFMNRDDHDTDESTWGLCDGHAEAVCYRLAGIYLLTELNKIHEMQDQDSIFEKSDKGYKLKQGIKFHLFTSHPPCGFMAKKERHLLSWKRPFVGTPHSVQCSSTILIGAYLGIQGPLSHLLVEPIYIRSITMPRYKTIETLHDAYIKERFETFQKQSPTLSVPENHYYFYPPHIQIVDTDPCTLFKECYKPYIDDEQPNRKHNQIPEVVASNRKRHKNKGINYNKVAGTIPAVFQNSGINTLVFTVDNGIGSKEFRDTVLHLQQKLVKLQHGLKEERLKSLQEARVRLCQALNVNEALGKLREMLLKQIRAAREVRQSKADKIIMLLTKSTTQPIETAELIKLYDELKTSLGQVSKDDELSKIINALGENVTYQKMLDDLDSLQEKHHSSDSEYYLKLMGCEWARYIETISDDVKNSIFD